MQICKTEIQLLCKEALDLPEFAGSTIRGAFGNILKQTACVQPNTSCQHCMMRKRCVYTICLRADGTFLRAISTIWSTTTICVRTSNYPKYHKGGEIRLGLLLYGDAIDYLAYFTYCFTRSGQWGLGRNRSPLARAYMGCF